MPSGFVYAVSPRRIRPFIKHYEGSFTSVKYEGISTSVGKREARMSTRVFHLGLLEAHEEESGWKFQLRLSGIREADLMEDQEKVAAQLLLDIQERVEMILALPQTASRNVGRLHLGFKRVVSTGEVKSWSFVPTWGWSRP